MKKLISMLMCLVFMIGGSAQYLAQENNDLENYFSTYTQTHDINGYVTVTRSKDEGYDVLYEGSLGDKGYTADSIFDLGSISKLYTTTMIFKCQEQGLLNINDTIDMYVEGVPVDKQSVTIKELLLHSSGIYADENTNTSVSKEEEINRILSTELLFEPGTNYRYSNSGFTLLAAIIESASGLTYEEYFYQNIIYPLGLNSTGVPGYDKLSDDNAVSGTLDLQNYGKVTELPYGWYSKGYADVLSTPREVTYFFQSLINNNVISDENLKLMQDDIMPLGNGHYRAIGAEVYDLPTGTYVGHTGVWYGGNSAMYYREEDGIMVTVLTDEVYVGSFYPAKELAKDFISNFPLNSLTEATYESQVVFTPLQVYGQEQETYQAIMPADSEAEQVNPGSKKKILIPVGVAIILIIILINRKRR